MQLAAPADSLYITSTEVSRKNSPILLGLKHFLEQKYDNVGYFRPIASVHDHHLELMKSQLELPQDVRQLYGATSDDAIKSWLDGKEDDLIEQILNKYEQCRKDHDFMIIEGSQITSHESAMTWKINVDVVRALGSPVLLLSDMTAVATDDESALVSEITSRTLLGKEQVEAAGLNYFGTIANRVRTDNPHGVHAALKARLEAQDLPFLGFLPHDDVLASKRLNEVAHKLGATHLFGAELLANNVVVRDAIVATSHLRDLFAHMKTKKDGLLVITSADRSGTHTTPLCACTDASLTHFGVPLVSFVDVLLGLLASRIPGVLPTVSGILLTKATPRKFSKEVAMHLRS